LAVLPLPSLRRSEQRFNVVWSVSDTEIETLGNLESEAFISAFQKAFGWRLGRVSDVGQRSQWPLLRLIASEQYRSGFLSGGECAHYTAPGGRPGPQPVATGGGSVGFRAGDQRCAKVNPLANWVV
jgi:2-polyprenyl-6-methoxyphenol hydroxylase-like FAD-dependent oxidoreductase